MSKAAKQWYRLTEQQLDKLVGQGTYPGAPAAWDRVRKIRDAGGAPVTFYSDFNGFTVFDEQDTNADAIRRFISIEGRSKAFPG